MGGVTRGLHLRYGGLGGHTRPVQWGDTGGHVSAIGGSVPMQWGGTRGPCTGKGHRGPCLAVGGWVGRTPPMDSGVPCASPGVTDVHPPGLMRTPSRTLRPPPQCSPTLPGPQPGDPPTASSMSAACGPWPSCDPPEIGGPNPHPPIKQVVVFLQSGEKNPNPLFFCGGGGRRLG